MSDPKTPPASEHTPEPWFINGSLVTSSSFDGEIVAEARVDIGPNWYANAKVIRSAPMLYRELKRVADDLEFIYEQDLIRPRPLKAMVDEIRATLARVDDWIGREQE